MVGDFVGDWFGYIDYVCFGCSIVGLIGVVGCVDDWWNIYDMVLVGFYYFVDYVFI